MTTHGTQESTSGLPPTPDVLGTSDQEFAGSGAVDGSQPPVPESAGVASETPAESETPPQKQTRVEPQDKTAPPEIAQILLTKPVAAPPEPFPARVARKFQEILPARWQRISAGLVALAVVSTPLVAKGMGSDSEETRPVAATSTAANSAQTGTTSAERTSTPPIAPAATPTSLPSSEASAAPATPSASEQPGPSVSKTESSYGNSAISKFTAAELRAASPVTPQQLQELKNRYIQLAPFIAKRDSGIRNAMIYRGQNLLNPDYIAEHVVDAKKALSLSGGGVGGITLTSIWERATPQSFMSSLPRLIAGFNNSCVHAVNTAVRKNKEADIAQAGGFCILSPSTMQALLYGNETGPGWVNDSKNNLDKVLDDRYYAPNVTVVDIGEIALTNGEKMTVIGTLELPDLDRVVADFKQAGKTITRDEAARLFPPRGGWYALLSLKEGALSESNRAVIAIIDRKLLN